MPKRNLSGIARLKAQRVHMDSAPEFCGCDDHLSSLACTSFFDAQEESDKRVGKPRQDRTLMICIRCRAAVFYWDMAEHQRWHYGGDDD
jgi:hypothetical protein